MINNSILNSKIMEGYYPYNISLTNMDFEQLLRNSSFNDSIEDLSLYTVPTGIVALLAFLYGSISLLSVLGNGIVIFVIARNKHMQTVTNIFIANLALADVVIGLFATPFQFQPALHQRWDLPKVMCSVAPSVKILSVSISVFTLAVISIDRYVAVMFPLKAGFSKKIAAIVLGIIWILGLASSIPEFLYFSVHMRFDFVTKRHDKPFCEPDWPLSSFGRYYHLVLFIIQYILPLIVINYSYFRIACRIWGNKTPGLAVDRNDRIRQRNKRKVVKMLIVVVCLFVLCWLPLQIYTFLAEFYEEINEYKYINIIWFCSNWLAMSNSCYNPFIYGLLNEKFKREFRLLFSICPCKGCPKKPEVIRLNDFSDDSDGGRRSVRIQSARNGHQCKNEYIYNKPFFHKRDLNFDLPSQTTLI